jgi:hypothetical protein
MIKKHKAGSGELLSLFKVKKTPTMREVAETVLKREARVYYFDRVEGLTRDISQLDPGSEFEWEAGWGGLSEFTGHVNEMVAKLVIQ